MNQPAVADSIFFDPAHALATARQRNRLPVWGHVDGCQVCYAIASSDDAPVADAPDNFALLDTKLMIDQLVVARTRLPTAIVFPPGIADETQAEFTRLVQVVMNEVHRRRQAQTKMLMEQIQGMALAPATGRALRVFANASRTTTVMQYASRGILAGFKSLGHEVSLALEANDCEELSTLHRLRAIEEFAPDLIFLINHHLPMICPPDVVQVTWWQDEMPSLKDDQPMEWRAKDLVYCLDRQNFQPLLLAKHLPESRIRVQQGCIDETVFQPDPDFPRSQRRLVFVGSNHIESLLGTEGQRLAAAMVELTHSGIALTMADFGRLAISVGIDPIQHDASLKTLWCSVVRTLAVHWACSLIGWEVEIYGYGWDIDPVVKPFFRGSIANGKPLADLYRGASHGLVVHPFLVNHQRLAEVACCGCTPVVFDCRLASEPPYWDDQCLYFVSETDFRLSLSRHVALEPDRFRRHFSYASFAERILADARSEGMLPSCDPLQVTAP